MIKSGTTGQSPISCHTDINHKGIQEQATKRKLPPIKAALSGLTCHCSPVTHWLGALAQGMDWGAIIGISLGLPIGPSGLIWDMLPALGWSQQQCVVSAG